MEDRISNEEISSIHQHQEPEWLVKYLKHQGDWLEKTRGNLMVAATVIASMSFQVMVNPPGGVWQQDIDTCSKDQSSNYDSFCLKKAGTSVLEYDDFKRNLYIAMVISSTVSFSASMSLILLVISGLRLRNRIIMGILVTFMVVAVLCMTAAFYLAVALVQSDYDLIINIILFFYLGFWVLFPGLIALIQFIRLLVWVIRLICRGRSRRSSSQIFPVFSTTQPVPNHSGVQN